MQLDSLVNFGGIVGKADQWEEAKPFPHLVIDDFFNEKTAKELEAEFPDFNASLWHIYSNKIEEKKTCNNWNVFPPLTYRVFNLLNSQDFLERLSRLLLQGRPVHADPGLNGGGWHAHSQGGKLNTHLDYSLHPKLGLQRKLNLIVYLNSNWQSDWGGHLGLWSNENPDVPGNLVKQVTPLFTGRSFSTRPRIPGTDYLNPSPLLHMKLGKAWPFTISVSRKGMLMTEAGPNSTPTRTRRMIQMFWI